VAAIDVAGYVAELKDHAVDHGFHVHDERHFVETYSLRQVWEVDPPDDFHLPLVFTWALPPLPRPPDLLLLATELAPVGGPDLALEVSAIDSFASVTDAPERSLTIVARQSVSLARVFSGEQLLCDVLDRCLGVSRFLLEQAPAWL
jgi:hypothetical protein